MSTAIIVFLSSVALIVALRYVVYPFWIASEVFDVKTQKFKLRYKKLCTPPGELCSHHFTSFFGTGEVLLGDFDGIKYNCFCLSYMPIIPLGCYQYLGETPSGTAASEQKWSWKEILYIYLRQYAIATACISAFVVLTNIL